MYGIGATKHTGWASNKMKYEVETTIVEPTRSPEDIERDARIEKRWGN